MGTGVKPGGDRDRRAQQKNVKMGQEMVNNGTRMEVFAPGEEREEEFDEAQEGLREGFPECLVSRLW